MKVFENAFDAFIGWALACLYLPAMLYNWQGGDGRLEETDADGEADS